MYLQNLNHDIVPGLQFCTVLKDRNHLEIDKVDYIRDIHKNVLIILAESNRMINNKEVYVFLRGNILIIEASMLVTLDKPIRTHLVEREIREEFEMGATEVGSTEIRLNKNCHYDVVSFSMIKPGLLKIILNYRTVGSLKN